MALLLLLITSIVLSKNPNLPTFLILIVACAATVYFFARGIFTKKTGEKYSRNPQSAWSALDDEIDPSIVGPNIVDPVEETLKNRQSD